MNAPDPGPRVRGSVLHLLVQNLMGAELLLPDVRDHANQVRDKDWLPWSVVVEACAAVAAVVEPETVVQIGIKVACAARPLTHDLRTVADHKPFRDWNGVVAAVSRGFAPASLPTLVDDRDGEAILDCGTTLPEAFVEGLIRGVILAVGGRVERYEAASVSAGGVSAGGASVRRCRVVYLLPG